MSRPRVALAWGVASFVLALGWSVIRIGPWPLPGLESLVAKLGTWRDPSIPDARNYEASSLPNQLVYELLGSSGPRAYLAQVIIVSAVALGLLAAWLAYEVGSSDRWRAARIAVLLPVTGLLAGFVGGYDAYTVLSFALVLWAWSSRRPALLVLAGAFAGFQHFEQALTALLALMLTVWALGTDGHGPRAPTPAWALLGAGIGKLGSLALLTAVVGRPLSGRTSYLTAEWVVPALKTTVNYLPIVGYGLFAGGWAIVVLVFLQARSRQRLVLVLALAPCIVAMAIAADHSRVFILVSLPSLMAIAARLLSDERTTEREKALAEAMAWVGVPVLVWTDSTGVGFVQHLGFLDQMIMSWQIIGNWPG